MSDDGPDNLVLRVLRNIDANVHALRDDVRDLRARVGAVEVALNAVRRDLVALAEADARGQASMDRLSDRIERVERRLQLGDG